MKVVLMLALLLGFTGSMGSAGGEEDLKLANFYFIENAPGPGSFVSERELKPEQRGKLRPSFSALVSSHWAAGLVPVFQVIRTNQTDLRRLPASGQENFSEPLFFGLPLETEPESAMISGRWHVSATKLGKRSVFTGWEFAAFTNRVAGRFDQATDYRFASINAGIFSSNRIQLKIQYIEDQFILEGGLLEGRLSGSWSKVSDESENGSWEATRPESGIVSPKSEQAVTLIEWAHGKKRRYLLETDNLPDPAAKRGGIARVWNPIQAKE